ncbi:hypothetical protein N7532_006425 [Penicillium argentinense]|uniref:Uncharacterized protein n=1 Tax=Penicillium argentinense TaxID=1131581 RepID=A0A9W9FG02_9EURO|nr:uncharacterized protein N7532_006425 [Penicillium argentinense]KAJ5099424.1 hypothetical protein N7532_006425 [Penicillium argentinense]
MSNNQPPPSHWGQAGYEQWPPYPGMMPSNPYLPTAPLPSTPPFPNPSHTFPYNMRAPDANAPAPPPSASAGPALFYQPAFPYTGHLDASNISTPGLPHLPIPPYGYPPVPAPSGSSQPLSGPWEIRSTDANQAPASRSQTQGPGDIIMNREEGELSEHGDRPTDTPNKASAQQSYSAPHCGLEEGETVSSATSSGSSSRTSPYTSFTRDRKANSSLKPAAYNPPLSVSADADVVHRAIENQKRDVPLASSEKSEEASTKSTAQMKIQAKGALLSLAAHGIRYDELVAEGCNAAILRTLYAEIGIRVPTSQADNASIEKRGKSTALRTEKPATTTLATAKSSGMPIIATTSSAPIAPTASSSHVTKSSEIKDSTSHERANPELPVKDASKLSEPVPAASVPSSKKPMERKEVIAKMLAAKAAQASEPNAPSKETSISAATKDSPAETTKLPVREINKAKTELARQRIEELKKKMLLKQREQQQIEAQQLGQASTTAQPNQPAVPGVTSAPAVQHPLPVRPPSPSAEPAKIPGLSLLGSNPDQTAPAVHPLALNSVTVNSTPVSRSAQRKRLQASDFDEPVGSPKKPFNSSEAPPLTETKLIIDISEDDESLYGDDQGDGMDIDSGPAVAPISTRSTLSRNSSAVRASTSTPQEHDQESIREKQLEIEALHRKIAEAEERQKARLAASGTQSPRTGNDSSVSSSAQSHIPDAREDDLAVDGNVRQEINDQNRTTTDVHVGDTVMNETEYEMYGRSLFANLPDSEKGKSFFELEEEQQGFILHKLQQKGYRRSPSHMDHMIQTYLQGVQRRREEYSMQARARQARAQQQAQWALAVRARDQARQHRQ